MSNFTPEEITKDRDLLDIYLHSRKLPKGRLSKYFFEPVTFFVFTILSIYAFNSPQSTNQLANQVRDWADFGFSFSIGIMGFLIAGFSIFATVSKPDLFTTMAKIPETRSQLSYLKYIFYGFINVFIIYLGFAFLCILIKIFAFESGILSILLDYFYKNEPSNYSILSLTLNLATTKRILAGLGIVSVGTWMFYLLVILQSFIFNIYYAVMTSIRWEIESKKKDGGGKQVMIFAFLLLIQRGISRLASLLL